MDAYEVLLALIRAGELTGETKISESALAERLGMSRTPVREALRVLDAQNLVVSRGRGIRIRLPEARELQEAFETRSALEQYAAQAAALSNRAGLLLPARLRQVQYLADQCHEVTRTQGSSAGAEANRLFHLAVASLADNRQINSLLTVVWDQIAIATRAGLTAPPRIEAVHEEHEAIVTAIAQGNPEAARLATARHIEHTSDLATASPQEDHG